MRRADGEKLVAVRSIWTRRVLGRGAGRKHGIEEDGGRWGMMKCISLMGGGMAREQN